MKTVKNLSLALVLGISLSSLLQAGQTPSWTTWFHKGWDTYSSGVAKSGWALAGLWGLVYCLQGQKKQPDHDQALDALQKVEKKLKKITAEKASLLSQGPTYSVTSKKDSDVSSKEENNRGFSEQDISTITASLNGFMYTCEAFKLMFGLRKYNLEIEKSKTYPETEHNELLATTQDVQKKIAEDKKANQSSISDAFLSPIKFAGKFVGYTAILSLVGWGVSSGISSGISYLSSYFSNPVGAS